VRFRVGLADQFDAVGHFAVHRQTSPYRFILLDLQYNASKLSKSIWLVKKVLRFARPFLPSFAKRAFCPSCRLRADNPA
jgi:hypothetical protein